MSTMHKLYMFVLLPQMSPKLINLWSKILQGKKSQISSRQNKSTIALEKKKTMKWYRILMNFITDVLHVWMCGRVLLEVPNRFRWLGTSRMFCSNHSQQPTWPPNRTENQQWRAFDEIILVKEYLQANWEIWK